MSTQKRKRDAGRKGFSKVSAAPAAAPEVVDYDEDSEDASSPKVARTRRTAASPKSQSPVRPSAKTAPSRASTQKNQKAPSPPVSSDSNKVKFQYPNCELKWSDNSAVFNALSHRERLIKALEAISSQETAALEGYFAELQESSTQKALKPELLQCLKDVLAETVQEVQRVCPVDIEFHPEVSGNTSGTAALEAKRDRLQAQADELEGYLQNMGEFGKKHNVSTSVESIEQLYSKATAKSKRSSSSGDKYTAAANQLGQIVSHINSQCDDIIEKYINRNVKGTLSFVQQSQAGLYDTYQKVRGSSDPVVPKNKLLSPSYNSRSGSADGAKSLEVHEYVNLLQSQTGSSRPFVGNSTASSATNNASRSQQTSNKTKDSKKLLRGFGKT